VVSEDADTPYQTGRGADRPRRSSGEQTPTGKRQHVPLSELPALTEESNRLLDWEPMKDVQAQLLKAQHDAPSSCLTALHRVEVAAGDDPVPSLERKVAEGFLHVEERLDFMQAQLLDVSKVGLRLEAKLEALLAAGAASARPGTSEPTRILQQEPAPILREEPSRQTPKTQARCRCSSV